MSSMFWFILWAISVLLILTKEMKFYNKQILDDDIDNLIEWLFKYHGEAIKKMSEDLATFNQERYGE